MAAVPPIKIGILGCADIARKLSRAIALSPNSTGKAAKFALDNGLPGAAKVYGSYEAVLDDPEVDAVYVPLPTSLHIKWAVLATRKKKHLLLEKPVALNVGEFDVIMEARESGGVQFMDATMWVHHPRTAEMREFLSDSSRFGQLKTVHSRFTFAAKTDFLENDIRVKPDLDALGALGDAGWYCTRSILWAADFELPETVLASRGTVFNGAGVIMACSVSLQWQDGNERIPTRPKARTICEGRNLLCINILIGKTATFHCSFLSNLNMDVTVVGTNAGTLKLNDFVVPFEEQECWYSAAVESGFTELITGRDAKPSERVVTTGLPQEALLVEEFSRLVGSVKYDGAKPETKWPVFSGKTQLVLDAVKSSIEKGYEMVGVMG